LILLFVINSLFGLLPLHLHGPEYVGDWDKIPGEGPIYVGGMTRMEDGITIDKSIIFD
jgi:hypothetical protein